MKELIFPLVGALAVYLVAVPAATVLCKGVLVVARRRIARPERFAGGWIWLLLLAPVVLTVPWFVSAAVHESHSDGSLRACLYDHFGGGACQDVEWFAGATAVLLLGAVAHRVRRLWRDGRGGFTGQEDPARSVRVQALRARCPELADLRIRVVRGARAPLCTVGLVRPWIEVDAEFADGLEDGALRAVLLHEAAHVRGLDPLRGFLARAALSINPAAPLLRPELARWRLAREVECDRRAVAGGADPFALAQAILGAARMTPKAPALGAVGLAGDPMGALRLRVNLLLAYAGPRRRPARRDSSCACVASAWALLLAAVAAPHLAGSSLLASLHWNIEHGLARLF